MAKNAILENEYIVALRRPRQEKSNEPILCRVVALRCEVNQRGDLIFYRSTHIVAAFASGSWLSAYQGESVLPVTEPVATVREYAR